MNLSDREDNSKYLNDKTNITINLLKHASRIESIIEQQLLNKKELLI